MTRRSKQGGKSTGRRRFVLFLFACMCAVLLGRAAYLQIFQHEFLLAQGKARQNRVIEIPANRGSIFDRNGAPLAVSTPIDTVWAVPAELSLAPAESRTELAGLLGISYESLESKVVASAAQGREFVYIKRHIKPEIADKVRKLDIRGVSLVREYARYYPARSAASHVVGFTNIDDQGVEGLELSYNDNWLDGEPGKRRIVRDLRKREIDSLEIIRQARPGKDLELSIDKRLQYQAHIALADAVGQHKAESGSLVLMDVRTGEVLAMTNSPSYNPNNVRERGNDASKRNRAVTDQFEPGSTMKPFTIAAALESGTFNTSDIIYTSPGYYRVGRYEVKDALDYGWLDLRGIIKKSSNVGVTKVAQKLDPEQMWSVFDAFGFGRPPGSEFPGEIPGLLNHSSLWHSAEQSTLSYGYGLAATTLQLTRAYATIANKGIMPEVSFLKKELPSGGIRVISESTAKDVAKMLESVVTAQGTGLRAKVPGFRIAGKTGTSYRSYSGGYDEERYISLFAGFAPASDPRLALVVVLHDPSAGEHYGGQVAAPVFSQVMGHALRVIGIKPDDWSSLATRVADAVAAEENI